MVTLTVAAPAVPTQSDESNVVVSGRGHEEPYIAFEGR